MLRELVTFVIVLAALVIRPAAAGMLSALVIVVVGFYVGASALSATRRAHAYRSGWLDGRARMIDALREAMQRGHTLEDWIGGELARDYAALGVDPTRENEREGGDDEAP